MLPMRGIVDCVEFGAGSSSGATRRSHEMVRIALASLSEFVLKLAMRLVVMSCIASSACLSTLDMSGESGYRTCRRRMWAFKSSAEA